VLLEEYQRLATRGYSHEPFALIGTLHEARVANTVGTLNLVLVEDASVTLRPVLLVPVECQYPLAIHSTALLFKEPGEQAL
jgi:hypothetical protein